VLHQRRFGLARSRAGDGKWSNTSDAVQVSIRVPDIPDNPTVVVSHVIGRDNRVCDLALERGCEAVPCPGKTDFEAIGVHGFFPCLHLGRLPRQILNVSQVSLQI
jgi:hypothetical protein